MDDLKAAATDALKKAASLLGVGLHLYEKTGVHSAGAKGNGDGKGNGGAAQSSGPSQSDSGNGHSRLTARQLAAIYAIAKSKGMDKDDVQRMSVQNFDRMPDFLSKSQASNLIQALQSE